MTNLFLPIVFGLTLVNENTALSISTKQPYFPNVRVKQSFAGISIAEFRVAGATLHSSSNSDDEGVVNKALPILDTFERKNENYTSSPNAQLQVQERQMDMQQIAIDELEEQEKDWELEIQDRLKLQRQELESKHYVEVTRLRLTLSSTREELNEMEDKAKTFEAKSKDLKQQLAKEIREKGVQLNKLEREWTKKYKTQTKMLNGEKLELTEKMEQQKIELISSIENLKDEMTMFKERAKELEEKTQQLEDRNAAEIENKRNALKKLERDLTEKFEAEANELKEWGTQNEKALDEYTKYAEAEILKMKAENQEQKEAMELQINTVTEDLGIVSRKLSNARKYHGTLRNEVHKVKQSAMFDMRKLRKSNEKLEKERDDAREEAATQKTWYLQLQLDMENLRNDLTAQIKDLQQQAAKDLSSLRNEWTLRLRATEVQAEKEKKEIIAERNQAVLERDTIIEEYEEELSNIQSMFKRSVAIIKARSRKRYERVETRLPVVKSTRLRVFRLSKRTMLRKDGKSRLTFLKPIAQKTLRTLKRKNKKSE